MHSYVYLTFLFSNLHLFDLLCPELCSTNKSVRGTHNFLPGQWPLGRFMPAGVVRFKQVSALRAQFPAGVVDAREVMPAGIVQFKQVSALRAQFPAGAVAVREGDGHSEGLLLAELCSSSKSVRCAHNFLPGQWLPGRLIPAGIVQFKQVSALRAQFPAGTVAAREVNTCRNCAVQASQCAARTIPAGAVAAREVYYSRNCAVQASQCAVRTISGRDSSRPGGYAFRNCAVQASQCAARTISSRGSSCPGQQ